MYMVVWFAMPTCERGREGGREGGRRERERESEREREREREGEGERERGEVVVIRSERKAYVGLSERRD